MSILFISDLHLEAARPESIEAFEAFCAREVDRAETLYILGDLFEAWVGDDEDDAELACVIAAIRGLSDAGVECRFMHGNRDFLAGSGFAAATGATLLGDYAIVEAYGRRILVTHGDLLCTDDTRYMELRATVRDAAWQSDFLAKPLPERRTIADQLRQVSKTETAAKAENIMDVNAAAVLETMRAHGVTELLHGHTHRPAVHEFTLDGVPARRIVLGDWYEQGSVARLDADGLRLETLPLETR